MSTENKDDKNTPSKIKHTGLYYIAAIVCACILTTAILLVVLLPNKQKNSITYPPTIESPDAPTVSQKITFDLPIQNAEVIQDFNFWHNSTTDVYKRHNGIDFKAAAGTEVKAVAAGTVLEASVDLSTGGKVVIDHGNGLKTVYKSIDIAENIRQGSKVEKGTVIGKVSSDVDCMGDEKDLGSHLHFEVLEQNKTSGNYENVDPKKYLLLSDK